MTAQFIAYEQTHNQRMLIVALYGFDYLTRFFFPLSK